MPALLIEAEWCISKLTMIGSDNGLSPGRRKAIFWTNAWILLTGPLGTNFSEILIEILTFSSKKMCLKVSSVKWRPFCLCLNVLTYRRILWWIFSTHSSWPELHQLVSHKNGAQNRDWQSAYTDIHLAKDSPLRTHFFLRKPLHTPLPGTPSHTPFRNEHIHVVHTNGVKKRLSQSHQRTTGLADFIHRLYLNLTDTQNHTLKWFINA